MGGLVAAPIEQYGGCSTDCRREACHHEGEPIAAGRQAPPREQRGGCIGAVGERLRAHPLPGVVVFAPDEGCQRAGAERDVARTVSASEDLRGRIACNAADPSLSGPGGGEQVGQSECGAVQRQAASTRATSIRASFPGAGAGNGLTQTGRRSAFDSGGVVRRAHRLRFGRAALPEVDGEAPAGRRLVRAVGGR
jgi:hypothetical protein